jgi:hypothetical protein
MPSPFPGMDPFLEGQKWTDFHAEFIGDLRAALVPLIVPAYAAHVEERVYVEHAAEGLPAWIRPDVALAGKEARGGAGAATLEAPATARIPLPERQRERFLELRLRDTGRLVTVIEVLSPTNKRPGADGYREYRAKRDAVLLSAAHRVEIDLLRGGERLPMVDPLPEADFYAIVSRAAERPECGVWFWDLRTPLPTLRIPLQEPDPDVEIDLQQVFTRAYDRAGYAYSLRYDAEVVPTLSGADMQWVREGLTTWRGGASGG